MDICLKWVIEKRNTNHSMNDKTQHKSTTVIIPNSVTPSETLGVACELAETKFKPLPLQVALWEGKGKRSHWELNSGVCSMVQSSYWLAYH